MERIQRRPQVVDVASDLANSLEVDSLVEYLRQCSGNQFEEDYFVDGGGGGGGGLHHPNQSQRHSQQQHQQQHQSPFSQHMDNSSYGDSQSIQVQWDKSWDQNLEGSTSKFSSVAARAAVTSSLTVPKNPPFLAKITSVGKTVRVLCSQCGEDKSIIYKTKFTLKVVLLCARCCSCLVVFDCEKKSVYLFPVRCPSQSFFPFLQFANTPVILWIINRF